MNSKFNWGVIGCGVIAKKFIKALLTNDEAKLFAVASTNLSNAKAYAKEFNAENFFHSYEDLIKHPDIDIVYIANCNTQHADTVRLCLEHGKAVLCEKPLTTNSSETRKLIELARKKDIFLMEGMWMRFHPAIQHAKMLIDQGTIGMVRMLKADFGYKTLDGLFGRQLNRSLGGGATLDVGVYVLHLAHILFKKMPLDVHSEAYVGETGVDEYAAYLLRYDQEKIALLSAAVTLSTSQNAEIIGENGRILIPDFWKAESIILKLNDKDEETIMFPHRCNGFEYEIDEVHNCLSQGKRESETMPWSATLEISALIDQMHHKWGISYS